MPIIVGGVVEQNGKYLLVQEAQQRCRGKWNIPTGHLEPNELIADGAKREIKEESGFEVELTGICQIGERASYENGFAAIIFSTKILSGEIAYDESELLDVKWFTYDEIKNMASELRNVNLITKAIEAVRENHLGPIDLVVNMDKG